MMPCYTFSAPMLAFKTSFSEQLMGNQEMRCSHETAYQAAAEC
jgi:hypothetical protein